MNKNTIWPISAGLAALVLAGCSGGAAPGYVPKKEAALPSGIAPDGQEASYFPFAIGSQWTYDAVTQNAINGRVASNKSQITYRLDKLTPMPNGGHEAYFTILDNKNQPTSHEVWRIDKTGLYNVGSGKTTIRSMNPPQLVVPFPVKPGEQFKWNGTEVNEKNQTIKQTLNGTIDGSEPIDTEEGSGNQTRNALAVEDSGTVKLPDATATVASKIWLAPNVGIGLFRSEMDWIAQDPKTKAPVRFQIAVLRRLKNVSLK